MLKKQLHRFLIIVLTVYLTACGYPHPPAVNLKNEPLLGPVIDKTNRVPALGACRKMGLYMATCDLIFKDKANRLIDSKQIVSQLDKTALQIPAFAKWVVKTPNQRINFPYRMHLLTISPAVVLVVPAGNNEPSCSTVYDQACLQSQAFYLQAYWYNDAPQVRADSFWFIEGDNQALPLVITNNKAIIKANNVKLELSNNNGNWLVNRFN